jgi:hypothetical protein
MLQYQCLSDLFLGECKIMPSVLTVMEDPYFVCPQSWLWSTIYTKLHAAWEVKQAAWLEANPVVVNTSAFDLDDDEEESAPAAAPTPVAEAVATEGEEAEEGESAPVEPEMEDFPDAINPLTQEAPRGIPAPPLMLPAFGASPGTLKERWRETVEWAQEYDCLALIPELHEDDCFFQ